MGPQKIFDLMGTPNLLFTFEINIRTEPINHTICTLLIGNAKFWRKLEIFVLGAGFFYLNFSATINDRFFMDMINIDIISSQF